MERADVAIIGGGPAGASAGEIAAAEDATVVVLEKGVPRIDRDVRGADSTDAGGFLRYWLDIADINFRNIPQDVVLREIHGARFVGPTERVSFSSGPTSSSSVPSFGFTFDRVGFDDWLRERAERAGAEYRVGTHVIDVEVGRSRPHRIRLDNDQVIEADAIILADGPGRSVTMPVLGQCMPDGANVKKRLGPQANHIAYQEYRRVPDQVFDPFTISFWWGWLPGETGYFWVFPNDENVARIGFTRPLDLSERVLDDAHLYPLLEDGDDTMPGGAELVRRFLREAHPRFAPEDFPVETGRGKSPGTESYPISSTRPIDSPVGANVAVTGGAMGATSAFHEGGYHLAIRSGKIAGRLAARGQLDRYNEVWKQAFGAEIARNVSAAAVVRGYGPDRWDRALATIDRLKRATSSPRPDEAGYLTWARAAGRTGVAMGVRYAWYRYRMAGGGYVQLPESVYTLD